MEIALIHDYLREYGGAERVVEALHEIWPEAPLYTAFVDWKSLGDHAERFKDWDIRTSWVQKNSIVKRFHSPLRFLAPKIWESFDLSEYDVVISSSGWFMCRGVITKISNIKDQRSKIIVKNSQEKGALHISYIHHPPRNLYGYATGSDLQKYAVVRIYAAIVNFFLRHYDYQTAQRVDYFIANSKETARRVWKFYRRDSTVIYPPVQVKSEKLKVKSLDRKYYLSVGRLTYAKRVDLAIQACNELKLPLKIVGTGKEERYLRSIARTTIEFMGSVSDEELVKLYEGAKSLIFCALDEDFGMVPVEAMAHGTAVVALGQGGVLETVVDGKTGVLFSKPTVADLTKALKYFNNIYHLSKFEADCRKQAEKFSKERFQKEIKAFVEKAYQKYLRELKD